MPGLRSKPLRALWLVLALILVLILAAMPRPAAGTSKDCPSNDEMAAPAAAEITGASATAQDPSLPAKGAAAVPVGQDHAEVIAVSRKTTPSHPAGTHGPRTPWPDMIPLGNCPRRRTVD